MFDPVIALLAGTLIGFFIAIPVGPVGLIVFQRSMFKSRVLGLVTGLGAAIGDGFLAAIGAFGIKIIWSFINENSLTLRVLGGLLILIIGLVAVFSKQKPQIQKKDSAISIIEHFISGFVLTVTNPIAAFTFFIIFARVGHELGIGGPGVASQLVLGVTFGSFLWWLLLTYLAKILGHKVKPDHIDIINKGFGLAIALVGAAMVLGAFLK